MDLMQRHRLVVPTGSVDESPPDGAIPERYERRVEIWREGERGGPRILDDALYEFAAELNSVLCFVRTGIAPATHRDLLAFGRALTRDGESVGEPDVVDAQSM